MERTHGLDIKLNGAYPGRVVRKDLLHQIKKGTNVPSFVLEFLLAKYCASDDLDEVDAGIAAVFETIQKNYVRPDEANKAQSLVQQKGRHKFIDKVHVTYVEREKRHWAEMENFNSRRIAIPEKFYQDNERLLAGGIWAEATVAHNDVDEDDYAFYIEDLRPIQLSRFNVDESLAGREQFSRDEWIDVLIRSIGLEPSKLPLRLKFHFLARLFSFVEANYNFIELGPRGTGKSYVFSEFSPYSTLVSGGQASTPVLFYNNARRQVGLVGYWDTVAFDEVGGIWFLIINTATSPEKEEGHEKKCSRRHLIPDLQYPMLDVVEPLRQATEAFAAAYGAAAKPFVWRKPEIKGSRPKNTIVLATCITLSVRGSIPLHERIFSSYECKSPFTLRYRSLF